MQKALISLYVKIFQRTEHVNYADVKENSGHCQTSRAHHLGTMSVLAEFVTSYHYGISKFKWLWEHFDLWWRYDNHKRLSEYMLRQWGHQSKSFHLTVHVHEVKRQNKITSHLWIAPVIFFCHVRSFARWCDWINCSVWMRTLQGQYWPLLFYSYTCWIDCCPEFVPLSKSTRVKIYSKFV